VFIHSVLLSYRLHYLIKCSEELYNTEVEESHENLIQKPVESKEESMSSKSSSKAELLYSNMKWPVVAYTILGCLYTYNLKGNIWFTWHPVAMLVSFVLMGANAALM
jgi:hypothetical protein